MSLVNSQKQLAIIERMATLVIRPEALPGIDISPLIDALIQFLLQLLEDCPNRDIRQAVEQSSRRPVIRMFWRLRLRTRLPAEVIRSLPDAAGDLLVAATGLSAEDWEALS